MRRLSANSFLIRWYSLLLMKVCIMPTYTSGVDPSGRSMPQLCFRGYNVRSTQVAHYLMCFDAFIRRSESHLFMLSDLSSAAKKRELGARRPEIDNAFAY